MADRSHNRPIVDEKRCHHGDCKNYANWGVASTVKQKNPDGSPLTLFVCDEHEVKLTSMMRIVGTRYTLFPINNQNTTPNQDKQQNPILSSENIPDENYKKMPLTLLLIINIIVIIVGIVIFPFVLIYFGSKWTLGWRPSTEDN
jgi:hypothetical protein